MGLQRRISGGITLGYGGFYGGTLAEATWRGRVEFTPQLYAEPTLSWNRIDAPFGNGNTNLLATRLTYTVTPRMFVAALVQYTSINASMSTNLRFRWEYQPGSELFVVYSDGRTTDRPRLSRPADPLVRRQGDEALPLVKGWSNLGRSPRPGDSAPCNRAPAGVTPGGPRPWPGRACRATGRRGRGGRSSAGAA